MRGLTDDVVREFCWLCDSAFRWNTAHRVLFDDNPAIETDMAGRHGAFLGLLSAITQEYSLHEIAKLGDPAIQNNRANLSCDYIIRFGGWDTATRAKLEALAKQHQEFSVRIRPARNRVLAHSDLESILDGGTLGAFEKDADRKFFEALQEFVNIVHGSTIGGPRPLDSAMVRHAAAFRDALATIR